MPCNCSASSLTMSAPTRYERLRTELGSLGCGEMGDETTWYLINNYYYIVIIRVMYFLWSLCMNYLFTRRPQDLDSLIMISVESGRMTHHLPLGYLGSLVAALFTHYAIQSNSVHVIVCCTIVRLYSNKTHIIGLLHIYIQITKVSAIIWGNIIHIFIQIKTMSTVNIYRYFISGTNTICKIVYWCTLIIWRWLCISLLCIESEIHQWSVIVERLHEFNFVLGSKVISMSQQPQNTNKIDGVG